MFRVSGLDHQAGSLAGAAFQIEPDRARAGIPADSKEVLDITTLAGSSARHGLAEVKREFAKLDDLQAAIDREKLKP